MYQEERDERVRQMERIHAAQLFIFSIVFTHPNDRVELRHGDLLGALDGGGDLLLVLLRQERQHLPHDGRQPLDDLGLKRTT